MNGMNGMNGYGYSSLPRYGAGKKKGVGGLSISTLVAGTLLLVCLGLGFAVMTSHHQVQTLVESQRALHEEIVHLHNTQHQLEASLSSKASELHAAEDAKQSQEAIATRLRSEHEHLGADVKRLSEELQREKESVETLNALVDAYKQHWSDEVTTHNQREQDWLKIQEEWEKLEKRMEEDIVNLRKQVANCKGPAAAAGPAPAFAIPVHQAAQLHNAAPNKTEEAAQKAAMAQHHPVTPPPPAGAGGAGSGGAVPMPHQQPHPTPAHPAGPTPTPSPPPHQPQGAPTPIPTPSPLPLHHPPHASTPHHPPAPLPADHHGHGEHGVEDHYHEVQQPYVDYPGFVDEHKPPSSHQPSKGHGHGSHNSSSSSSTRPTPVPSPHPSPAAGRHQPHHDPHNHKYSQQPAHQHGQQQQHGHHGHEWHAPPPLHHPPGHPEAPKKPHGHDDLSWKLGMGMT